MILIISSLMFIGFIAAEHLISASIDWMDVIHLNVVQFVMFHVLFFSHFLAVCSMNFFLINFHASLVCAIGTISIPFTIDWRDVLHARALVHNASGIPDVLDLTVTLAYSDLLVRGSESGNRTVSLSDFNNGVLVNLVNEDFRFRFTMVNRSLLPIGPFSLFRARLGDIAVIKNRDNNNGTILFNVSSEQFESIYCFPGSRIVLPWESSMWGVYIRIGTVIVRMAYNVHWFMVHHPGAIMAIPDYQLEVIRNRIEFNGALRVGEYLFNECTVAVLEGLGDIVLDFRRYFGQASLGSMVILPEDYIAFYTGSNQCYLKLIPAGNVRMARINPLAIPGINLRVSETTFEFCDQSD